MSQTRSVSVRKEFWKCPRFAKKAYRKGVIGASGAIPGSKSGPFLTSFGSHFGSQNGSPLGSPAGPLVGLLIGVGAEMGSPRGSLLGPRKVAPFGSCFGPEMGLRKSCTFWEAIFGPELVPLWAPFLAPFVHAKWGSLRGGGPPRGRGGRGGHEQG